MVVGGRPGIGFGGSLGVTDPKIDCNEWFDKQLDKSIVDVTREYTIMINFLILIFLPLGCVGGSFVGLGPLKDMCLLV